jgi:hypothetical protein
MPISDHAYLESLSIERTMLLSEEEQLHGDTTVSAETCDDLVSDGIDIFLHSNFPEFLKAMRKLTSEEQDLLLEYYILNKPQALIGKTHQTTQTQASFALRAAVGSLCAQMMLGMPTIADVHRVLVEGGVQDTFIYKRWGSKYDVQGTLSEAIVMYATLRNSRKVAEYFGFRGSVRQILRQCTASLGNGGSEQRALASYVNTITAFTRKQKGSRHIARTDPDIVGQFRVRVDDPNFGHMFVPSATRQ